jgi:hypothetical protein
MHDIFIAIEPPPPPQVYKVAGYSMNTVAVIFGASYDARSAIASSIDPIVVN